MPDAEVVSQPLPFSIVATAPMVVPAGTPASCTVWLGGCAPPRVCAKVRLPGVGVTIEDATVNVTGNVCAGTLGAELDTVMEPL